jgi:ActR/RegA family two-component response regulator
MERPTRVLIVDDRELVRKTLPNILIGYDCDFSEAEGGVKALELMGAGQFDVIFLDLRLPDLSGIEILRRARELEMVLGRVIILTGFPQPETEAAATTLGAFRYLTKTPIDWTEIRRAFAAAISEEERPSEIRRAEEAFDSPLGWRRVPGVRGTAEVEASRVLVLDDDQLWLDAIEHALGHDFDLTLTTSEDDACRRIRKERFALVVLDMDLRGAASGLDVLGQMRRARPDLRAIVLTEHRDYEAAVESGRRGALHCVPKGQLAKLRVIVESVLSEAGKPIRVFLSYVMADRAKVTRQFGKLTRRGFIPWMDVKSILPGKKWEPEIRRAIDQSDYFVFYLSRHSLYKEGMLRKELKQALERQDGLLEDSIFFITARLEDCEIVEPFKKFQSVDLYKRDGFEKLISALSPDRKDYL